MNAGGCAALVRRRAGIVVLAGLVATAVAAVACIVITPSYRATALVRIAPSASDASDFGSFDVQYADRVLNTYRRLVTTMRLVDAMQSSVEGTAGRGFEHRPKVSAVVPANTQLLALSVDDPDGELAIAGANAARGGAVG